MRNLREAERDQGEKPEERLWRSLVGSAASASPRNLMEIQILGPMPGGQYGSTLSPIWDFSLFTESWENGHLGLGFLRSWSQSFPWWTPNPVTTTGSPLHQPPSITYPRTIGQPEFLEGMEEKAPLAGCLAPYLPPTFLPSLLPPQGPRHLPAKGWCVELWI